MIQDLLDLVSKYQLLPVGTMMHQDTQLEQLTSNQLDEGQDLNIHVHAVIYMFERVIKLHLPDVTQ